MRRWRKWVLLLILPMLLITSAAWSAKSWWAKRAAPRWLTSPVSRGRVETIVNSTGTVKPALSVSVGAFTSGPLAEVLVDFNSKVKEGDLLARIDPKLAKAALARDTAFLESQQAELGRVEALLKQAENNESRARRLFEVNRDYISDTDMDQFLAAKLTTAAQCRLARATIAQARAALENSQANLGYTEIRSPVDGIVIDRKVDKGQTVAASFQTPELFVIAPKMDQYMHVHASVDEADIGQIRAAKERGQKVSFTVDAYPGTLFDGVIDQVRMSSTTTQNVVTYPVVVKAPNPELKLMPGMTANLSFRIEAKDDVLRVPVAALRFVPQPAQVRAEDRHLVEVVPLRPAEEGNKRSAERKAEQSRNRRERLVWVRDGELLRAVPITVGLIEHQYAEIVKGELDEDEELVVGIESARPPG